MNFQENAVLFYQNLVLYFTYCKQLLSVINSKRFIPHNYENSTILKYWFMDNYRFWRTIITKIMQWHRSNIAHVACVSEPRWSVRSEFGPVHYSLLAREMLIWSEFGPLFVNFWVQNIGVFAHAVLLTYVTAGFFYL